VDVASIDFTVPVGATSLTAYEWCNKHGLWEGPTVQVPVDFCPTMHAEFLRRQANAPWNRATPYNETDGAKHTPYITVTDSVAVVKVGDGSPYHPMSASAELDGLPHFITHIYVLDQDGGFVAMTGLDPSQSSVAELEFTIPEGTAQLKAYSFCNLHGLWEGSAVSVSPGTAAKTCGLVPVASAAWTSVVADLSLQQSLPPHSRSEAYNETHGAKHTPYITLKGNQATVQVGDGPYHPMTASTDPSVVHFITHIYVLDQDYNLVTMQELSPQGVDVASIDFTVPVGATSLTAYEWCNKHGLWEGPTVQVQGMIGTPADYGSLTWPIPLIVGGVVAVAFAAFCAAMWFRRARPTSAAAPARHPKPIMENPVGDSCDGEGHGAVSSPKMEDDGMADVDLEKGAVSAHQEVAEPEGSTALDGVELHEAPEEDASPLRLTAAVDLYIASRNEVKEDSLPSLRDALPGLPRVASESRNVESHNV
jgi:desulfoferrodoxin (superoxide reductase-like protein)